MFPNLTPPTDNLYKFCSIFGLILIGISVWMFVTLRNQDTQFQADLRIAELDAIEWDDYAKEAVEENFDEMVNHAVQAVNEAGLEFPADKSTEAKMSIHDLRVKMKQSSFHKEIAAELKREITVSVKVDNWERMRAEMSQRVFVGWCVEVVLTLLGSCLCIYGFQNWKDRIQEPDEEYQKVQYKLAKAQL